MLRNVKDLTWIAEKEIHAVVLSCVRARRELLDNLASDGGPYIDPREAGAGHVTDLQGQWWFWAFN